MPSVTRNPRRNRAQRRVEIEQAMLEATERLMNGGSTLTELSVDRLATEAGISRATFYIYFDNKGSLLGQLARQVFAELSDATRQWCASERGEPSDVHGAVAGIVAGYRRHQSVITAVVEMAAYDPGVAATYRDIVEGIAGEVEKVIELGRENGSIRDLAVRETATTLTWMVERTCYQIIPDAPIDDDYRLVDSLTEIIWGAVYLRSAH